MDKDKIKDAIKYANSSSSIEDMGLRSGEEVQCIFDAILKGKKDESFLFELVKKVMKDNKFIEGEVKNGKVR